MYLDQSQLKNKAAASQAFEVSINFNVKDSDTSVKAFLCKASTNDGRVSIINDETVVDLNQRSDPYTHGMYSRKFTIVGDRFYTIVLSNYRHGQKLTGEIEIESNFKLIVKPIPAEGTNMKLALLPSSWTSQTAGGCKNHPTYGANPAW